MSDQCFLCRINTVKGQCFICQAKCHDECWVAYCVNWKNSRVNQDDLKCPQCSSSASTTLIRSKQEYVQSKAIYIMDEYIKKGDRSLTMKQIFEYLSENKEYLNTVFLQNVEETLIYLYRNRNWIHSPYLYRKFFDTDIPRELTI
jgi:hypothetical protein